MDFSHKPVLLSETVEGLNIKENGTYVDGTLGGGGHAAAVCERLSEKGRFIGIDQDEAAIQAAGLRLQPYQDRVRIDIIRSNYQHIPQIISGLGIDEVDGFVLDLGVSSYQLDTVDRGFTYREDAPLDMRMDQRQEMTAKDILNDYSEQELYRIIRDYGEERFAKPIARHICLARQKKVISTTYELNDIIKAAIPIRARSAGGHPSKRTFQAIRIELNQELTILEQSIDQLIDRLKPGGRICIITFHSLEDRIVKRIFKTNENPCTCPPDFPLCVCGRLPRGKVITRKPILPSEEELTYNRRSKSAKLRIFERI
ncbi:MAG: 16S rRNA (cytosine(1402)-N(4))-methyltransferase RsmH [Lachnospiraceae bacterium]|nr:16S rRNA (cytosine(1402)-N(4))-methyltransferase RsmH [Lachnospiraceae bacterium]